MNIEEYLTRMISRRFDKEAINVTWLSEAEGCYAVVGRTVYFFICGADDDCYRFWTVESNAAVADFEIPLPETDLESMPKSTEARGILLPDQYERSATQPSGRMVCIPAYIRVDQRRALDSAANRFSRSRAGLIREALDRYLPELRTTDQDREWRP